ncbi:MAG: phosphate ABC transporter permease subunit PstC [Bacteroidetes bacterium]|nr:MAG: phosphate ABC transporter permease subunit PstC [Bacteroidota bacterium]
MSLKSRLLKDKYGKMLMLALVVFCLSIAFFIGLGLYSRSVPLLKIFRSFELLSSSEWVPGKMKFGLFPFITGTLWVTVLSMLIAIPPCVLAAIYLTEYANQRVVRIVRPVIDVLAGIPSVIFGVWGIILIIPFIRDVLAPIFGVHTSGYTVLAGAIVLAVSVFPIVLQLLIELFKTVPEDLRNASLSLGATQWQTIKFVMLRKAGPGVVSAVVIAFSRAFGETMSVIMVTGNVPIVPSSIFDPAYPLPSLIANNFGEMLSIPLYDSALMFVALVLFLIVLIFNIISRYILRQVELSSV